MTQFLLALLLATGFAETSIFRAKQRTAAEHGFPCLLRGSVTLAAPGEFYIQDETSGVLVVSEPYSLHAGQQVQVRGWMYLASSSEFRVRPSQVWHLSEGVPAAPRTVGLDEALSGAYEGRLISVSGTVLRVRRAVPYDSIWLASGRDSIRVFFPASEIFARIHPGLEVTVTGISTPQTVDPEFDGYQVRLRSPADLVVQQAGQASEPRAPASGRWTAALASAVLAGAVSWIWTLRRRTLRLQDRLRSAQVK